MEFYVEIPKGKLQDIDNGNICFPNNVVVNRKAGKRFCWIQFDDFLLEDMKTWLEINGFSYQEQDD